MRMRPNFPLYDYDELSFVVSILDESAAGNLLPPSGREIVYFKNT